MNIKRLFPMCVMAATLTTLPSAPAQHATQELQPGQIAGHVIDATGATISEASVFVRRNISADDNVKLLTHTDVRGDFTLSLPEGGYDILVTHPGFAATVKTVSVLPKKTRKDEWKLNTLSCTFPGMNCDTFQ